MNNRKWFRAVLEPGSLRLGCPSGEHSLPGHRLLTPRVFTVWEERGELPAFSLIRASLQFTGAPPSWPRHLPTPRLLTPSHWGFQHINWGSKCIHCIVLAHGWPLDWAELVPSKPRDTTWCHVSHQCPRNVPSSVARHVLGTVWSWCRTKYPPTGTHRVKAPGPKVRGCGLTPAHLVLSTNTANIHSHLKSHERSVFRWCPTGIPGTALSKEKSPSNRLGPIAD